MAATTPSDPEATRIPYAQATPHQLAQALSYAMQELGPYFQQVGFASWGNAILRLQPDLWLEGELLYLDHQDLVHLTQRVAAAPELPAPDHFPVYNDQAGYLARRLVKFQHQALHALAEVEAAPRAYGGSVLALVLDLAAGNGIAQQVYRDTAQERPRPGGPDPAAVRQAAAARVEAVRAARGELASLGVDAATWTNAAAGQ